MYKFMMKIIYIFLALAKSNTAASEYFQTYRTIQRPFSAPARLNLFDTTDFCADDKLQFRSEKELQEELNKKLVMKFYQEVFIDRNFSAAPKYLNEDYIQHNPNIADGRNGLLAALNHVTKLSIQIHQIGADGNFVFIHSKSSYEINGKWVNNAIVDICKVINQKIVEHWDVIQSYKLFANKHPFF